MFQKYLFATVKHVADGLVGGSGDLELVDICGAAVGEHLADGHHVGGQGAGFVGANDRGTAESFNRRQRSEIIQQK